MKGIDIFCASRASTAIRLTTMDQEPPYSSSSSSSSSASSSSSSSSAAHLGGSRAIDRHNPIIRDARRIPVPVPCNSHPPPLAPIPYKHLHHKGSRKSSDSSNNQARNSSKKLSSGVDQKKKSDYKSDKRLSTDHAGEIVRKSFGGGGGGKAARDLINGPDSSRYLLGETGLLDLVSDFDPVLELVPVVDTTNNIEAQLPVVKTESSSSTSNSKPPSSTSSRSPDQVVVLRVSLHCKGCEGKVRKHISRMQGVTSFDIDFAAKKVTVVGDVTPSGVLASISKVKTAQLWTPPPPPMAAPSAPTPPSSTSFSELIKKNEAVVAI